MSEVTRILQSIDAGDIQASKELLPLVYEELRKVAAVKLAGESADHTLQPTALVHEAWLRLTGNENVRWDNRFHFVSAAAEAMRRILIERARRKQALKRGAGAVRADLALDQIMSAGDTASEELLALDEGLEKLAQEDPQSAELIKLRFFVGLTNQEAARALGISERSAKRYWAFGRAWLYHQLRGKSPADPFSDP